MWTPDYIGYMIVTILTLALTKGVPMLSAWMRLSTADRKVKSAIEAKGYEGVICRLDERVLALEADITHLRSELEMSRKVEMECRVEQAKLAMQIESLKHDLETHKRNQ
jgi:D-ribose pyranose/furanose isomerase RbsD